MSPGPEPGVPRAKVRLAAPRLPPAATAARTPCPREARQPGPHNRIIPHSQGSLPPAAGMIRLPGGRVKGPPPVGRSAGAARPLTRPPAHRTGSYQGTGSRIRCAPNLLLRCSTDAGKAAAARVRPRRPPLRGRRDQVAGPVPADLQSGAEGIAGDGPAGRRAVLGV